MPKKRKHSITYDNGSEFNGHEMIEKDTTMIIFFAHPYHSWERGTSENTNGLIRRYLPKGTTFANLKQETLDKIVYKINHRPRKRLNYCGHYKQQKIEYYHLIDVHPIYLGALRCNLLPIGACLHLPLSLNLIICGKAANNLSLHM